MGWTHWEIVNGIITWHHVERADAVMIERGAYAAWRCLTTPDGGQSWVRAGHWSTAGRAMLELDNIAAGKGPSA